MIYFKMEKIGNTTHNKEKKTRSENLVFNTIPAAGVEPARPCGHWILSPARLPIPPRRHIVTGVAGFEPTHEGVKVPCLTAWLYPIKSPIYLRWARPLPHLARRFGNGSSLVSFSK